MNCCTARLCVFLSFVAHLKPEFNPLIVSEDVMLSSVSLRVFALWHGGPEAQNSLRKQIK